MTEGPEHDAVRRLLADARHTEPMPADVAARLDSVIRGLGHEDEDLAPIVTLPRHRRRAAAALLVAAAAIVVGGVSLASLEHRGSGTASNAGVAADAGARGASDGNEGYAGSAGGATGSAPSGAGKSRSVTPQAGDLAAALPVRVRAHHFTSDAARARKALRAAAMLDSTQRSEVAACPAGSIGRGIRVPASYDGSRAVLVYRSPAGGSQVVDLYLCGGHSPVRTATLPQAP